MKIIGKVIGHILFWGGAIYLWIVGTLFLLASFGTLGLYLGIFLPPIDFFIPFIYWFMTGDFPSLYFLVWGISIIGTVIIGFSSKESGSKIIQNKYEDYANKSYGLTENKINYCQYCGKKLPDYANYCDSCGKKINR